MSELKITEADAERLNSKMTMIVTPIARDPKRRFTACFMETVQYMIKAGLKFHVKGMAGCSDLAYARNHLASDFLASDCTDLIWIDDDIAWDSKDVLRLILSDKDYIGGGYRKKLQTLDARDPMSWCVKFFKDEETILDESDGTYEVQGLGLGFVKTSRKVLQAIVDANPELKRGWESTPSEPKDFYGFVHFDGFGNGEDFVLCDLWRKTGGKVWLDPAINLVHCGDYEYYGDVKAMISDQARKESEANRKSAA